MKRTLSLLVSAVLVICAFTGCTQARQASAAAVLTAVSPVEETVDLHTFGQNAFLQGPDSMIRLYANGDKEKSRPKAVEFTWDYTGTDAKPQFTVRISETPDMQDCLVYTSDTNELSVYNLKIATDYYWTVSTGDAISEVVTFTTDDQAPRNLYIDGVTNARDLGGWETESGTRTKQGMIFRCGRLNESDVDTVNIEITESGKQTMLDLLGIKTEIDVRLSGSGETGGITSSPLGDSVQYINVPMEWDGPMFAGNREQIVQIFSILADASRYPLCFHCNIGTDRTGMLSFLINALLGVPEEDLYKDFLFSNFGNIGGKRSLEKMLEADYYTAVTQAQGSTLSEKAYNCLLGIGVPAAHLDSVIELLSA